ncbi:hypothetical protein GCM10009716_29830 [Streptomyces sodiiphilus]|uniref:Uncharacterized protein n=1 Tax=Streptomyces sodiiphilus TaxID=226217 RepID=A0ABN2PF64_9ACTN
MPTYEQLYHLRLDNLTEAEQSWRTVARDLGELAEEARTGMRAKVLRARWRGENAAVTGPFVLTTAERFDKAHEQAEVMGTIVGELREQLATHRRDLRALAETAREEGLTVRPDGTVLTRSEGHRPEILAEGQAHALDPDTYQSRNAEHAAHTVAANIRRILDEAATADADAARALSALGQEDPENFPGTHYADIDEAREHIGAEAAREAIALIDSGAQNTDEGLAELAELMATHQDNEHFASALATGLGARESLALWSDLLDSHAHPQPSSARLETLAELRDSYGAVLGEATRSGHPGMARWRDDILALGLERFGPNGSPSPNGAQLMSDLMRSGEYDPDFLEDYSKALISWEKAMDPPASGWSPPGGGYVPLLGEDFRWDPMTGCMEALSRSPEAATAIFVNSDRAEYLLKDRPYEHLPPEGGPEGGLASRHAIGDALFAAASGISLDDDTATFVEHDRHHQTVVRNALNHLAGMENDMPMEYREPMARVLANHGQATHETMSNVAGDTPLDGRDLIQVTTQVMRSPESYALLQGGMHHAIVSSFHDASLPPEDTLDAAGQTIGYLEQARYRAIEANQEDPTWKKHWFYHSFGAAVTGIPFVGDSIQRSVDMASSAWLEDEINRIKKEAAGENIKVYELRRKEITALGDAWFEVNGEWAATQTGYSQDRGVYSQLGNAATRGKQEAEGAAG